MRSNRDKVVLAFPGAYGFGAQTVGGRAGKVVEVTNLNDSGPGSLRAAVSADYPRTVVFQVNGIIELESTLIIDKPYITIAGQTALGSGVTLKGAGLEIRTNNAIIRFLRIRPGPGGETDSLNLVNTHNVIVDHTSLSWSTDEVASAVFGSSNITFQWSIFSEGLLDSSHPDGPHSKGSLISLGAQKVSIHHNLYAHNDDRNAILHGDPTVFSDRSPIFDFVNNLIYNWRNYATAVSGNSHVNVVGNYYKAGPNAKRLTGEVLLTDEARGRLLYIEGNVGPTCPEGCNDDWAMVAENSTSNPAGREDQSISRFDAPLVVTTSAFEAYDTVLQTAGAICPVRDAVDDRIIQEVQNITGQLIDNPSQVGGWPKVTKERPAIDNDHDGMPDRWEFQHNYDPTNSKDGAHDSDGDGYTNLEAYLNGDALKCW